MFQDLQERLKKIEDKLVQLGGFFDLASKTKSIQELQERMNQSDFWNDANKANQVLRELKQLKSYVEPHQKGIKKMEDLKELLEVSKDDEEFLKNIDEEIQVLEKEIAQLEVQSFLSGKFDQSNAVLSINAGAGGTESCDWASMLLRMYNRWAEEKGYKVDMVDILHGDEAGVKNATLRIEGEKAYGFLKAEKGVHRLVRISPFDSNKRRHTSFASIDVIPEIEDDVAVDINPSDLRIDIYRSSGPGGQSVNTTDSAVRLTHIPTGIVVACQNERSQLQNRQMAMKILRARIHEKKRQEQDDRMAKEYGQKQKIEWGSQIRSYVMHPYSMVKDHRTDVETGNVNKVMDGDLDMFIEAFLRIKPE
ncbi:MAG: peptide chain release factor 2 [Candidatus Omnitrophica bacterium]|nr:peptide chain release factor 2 [Candidatus Omnitrophota bacterium]